MVEIDEKQIFSIIQKASESGVIRIGANESTKAVERGQAKLVVTASDVSPAEIVAHFEPLCKEMKVAYASMGSRAELGSAVGIKSTSSVTVIDAGSAKKELEKLSAEMLEEDKKEEKAPAKEEVKEEASEQATEEKAE